MISGSCRPSGIELGFSGLSHQSGNHERKLDHEPRHARKRPRAVHIERNVNWKGIAHRSIRGASVAQDFSWLENESKTYAH